MECPTSTNGPCSPATRRRVCRSRAAVMPSSGRRGVLAPALPGAVVGADACGGADLGDDACPRGGDLAETVVEHDRGAALAAAVEVETVAADVEGGAGSGRVGVVVADHGDVLDGGGDGGESQYRDDRGQEPASAAGQLAPRPEPDVRRQRQHRRRPHPRDRRQHRVAGREDDESETRGAHRHGRDRRPALGPAREACGQRAQQGPAGSERDEHRPGDGGLGRAGEDDEGQDQRGDQSGGQGARDDAGDRPGRRCPGGGVGAVVVVGVDVDAHGGLALAVGWSTAVERGRERVCSPRSDGQDRAPVGRAPRGSSLSRLPRPGLPGHEPATRGRAGRARRAR